MIPGNASLWQTQVPPSTSWREQSWQEQLSNMIRNPDELLACLGLKADDEPAIAAALAQFPLKVTQAYIAKMTPGDWRDPLLLQVLPQAAESLNVPGYGSDPLAEKDANPVPGLVHKYAGRVLLIATSACAIHCRYCFRRNFPYSDNNPSQAQWQEALDYIAERPDIHEVILSGGDPLAIGDDYLERLVTRIAEIPHIDTLRMHTRLPLVLPARITPELVNVIQNTRLQTVMVIHSNHPREIDTDSENALLRLRDAGVTLLNQSVLLRNINDDPDTLSELSKRLFQAGVLPYYLHLLDKVRGAAHFDVAELEAQALMDKVIKRLPGYLVPRLVREVPGEGSKSPIALSLNSM